MSIIRRNNLLNTADNLINPATEDKQDDIVSAIQTKKNYSTGNKTTTPLAGGATFTGDWEEVTDYIIAIIEINVDQESATDGVLFELSDDGVNVRHYHSWTIRANDPAGHHYPSTLDAKYFRVKYTNGAAAQGSFYLATTYFTTAPEDGHAHAVDYVIDDDHPAPVRKSVTVAKTPAGTYENVGATNGGNFKMSLEELESGISTNSNSQLKTTEYDSSGNELGSLSHAGIYSKAVTQRPVETFSVHLNIEALAAATDYILIDLSDSASFPHTNTGHIHIDCIDADLNPDTSFRGDIQIGYLKNVDDTDGDFVLVKEFHQDLQSDPVHMYEQYFPTGLICTDTYHLGPVTANDTAFQTDVNLTSPAGTSPSGDGDLVMRVSRTAGSIDIGITILYHTET